MQISSSALPIQVNPQQREQASARNQNLAREREERVASDAVQPDVDSGSVSGGNGSGVAGDVNREPVQRVEASTRSESSDFQRVRSFDELPLNSRNALDSYQAAAQATKEPSASQLAGVDVFV